MYNKKEAIPAIKIKILKRLIFKTNGLTSEVYRKLNFYLILILL